MHKFRKIYRVPVSPQIEMSDFYHFLLFSYFLGQFDSLWCPRTKYFDKYGQNMFTSADCNFIHKLSKFEGFHCSHMSKNVDFYHFQLFPIILKHMAKSAKTHSLEQNTTLRTHLERFRGFQCPHKSRNVWFLSFFAIFILFGPI